MGAGPQGKGALRASSNAASGVLLAEIVDEEQEEPFRPTPGLEDRSTPGFRFRLGFFPPSPIVIIAVRKKKKEQQLSNDYNKFLPFLFFFFLMIHQQFL